MSKIFTTLPPYLVISRGLLKYVKDYIFSGTEFLLDIGKELASKSSLEKCQIASKLYLKLTSEIIKCFKESGYEWVNLKILMIVPDSWDYRENIKLAQEWLRNYRWVRKKIEQLGFIIEEYVVLHRCLKLSTLFDDAELSVPEVFENFEGYALGSNTNTVTNQDIKCGENRKNAKRCIEINRTAVKLIREKYGDSRKIHILGAPLKMVLIPLIHDGVKFDSADTTSFRLDILHYAYKEYVKTGREVMRDISKSLILVQWLMSRYFHD